MAVEDTWNKEGGYNEAGEHYVISSFMICTPHQIFLGGQIKDRMGEAWGRNEMHTGFWWVNLKKRHNLQDLGVDGTIILKLVMNTYYGRVWTGFICLRTQKSREVLWINRSVPYNASEILDYLGNYKISFSVILTSCIPLCLILKQYKAYNLFTQAIVFTSSTNLPHLITCCSYHSQL